MFKCVCVCVQGKEKALRGTSVCMHVREEFPDRPVSFNVQSVYMNDAKEEFADKASVRRWIKTKLVDMNLSFTVRAAA